ncbi:response regulator, partial [bacterium]
VHVARDITNEKQLREQLFHSEKLSSVGKLVAGIAHELNNPLMGILGFSQILMDMPGDKKLDDVKDKLKKIYQESLRTARIVQNLLTFARSQKTEREFTDINDIIRRTLDLKEYSLGANKIKTAFELAPNLPNTMADPYQLQQVFINIINNAEDAMTDYNKSGRLEIKTRKNRNKILITFKDDGPGIPKNILKKVFDPFFTTKEVGKGTGLGLSITHGIVTEHGGAIDITVPEAGGALVTIELPIIEKEQWTELKKAIDIETALTSEEKQTGKKILVVDDEITIREALTEFLTRAGFDVTAAGTGKEGAELIEKNGFSLVIADIKLPDINGMELYDIAVNKSPALKESVIIITGAVLNPEIKNFVERTKCPLVLKPFTMTSLLKVIRDMPLK